MIIALSFLPNRRESNKQIISIKKKGFVFFLFRSSHSFTSSFCGRKKKMSNYSYTPSLHIPKDIELIKNYTLKHDGDDPELYRHWTDGEILFLLELSIGGYPDDTIYKVMGRTLSSLTAKRSHIVFRIINDLPIGEMAIPIDVELSNKIKEIYCPSLFYHIHHHHKGDIEERKTTTTTTTIVAPPNSASDGECGDYPEDEHLNEKIDMWIWQNLVPLYYHAGKKLNSSGYDQDNHEMGGEIFSILCAIKKFGFNRRLFTKLSYFFGRSIEQIYTSTLDVVTKRLSIDNFNSMVDTYSIPGFHLSHHILGKIEKQCPNPIPSHLKIPTSMMLETIEY